MTGRRLPGVSPRLWRRVPPTAVVAEAALALYLSTAAYKALTVGWAVDITALTGGAALLMAGWRLVEARGRVPRGIAWAALYFSLVLVPIITAPALSAYGAAKVAQFYSVALLAVVATALIVRDDASLDRFVRMLAVPGLILVAVSSGSLTADSTERLDIGTISSVSLGRTIGMSAMLVLVYAHYASGARSLGAVFVSFICLVAILFVGNRQGLIGALVGYTAVLGVLVRNGSLSRRAVRRGGLAVVALAGALIGAFRFIPQRSLDRILGLQAVTSDESSAVRLEALGLALRESFQHPMGSGWGAFYDLGFYAKSGENIAYPHNVFVEILHEFGFPAFVLFALWVVVALRRTYTSARVTGHPARVALFGLVVFNLFVSSVSGESSSEKLLWATLVLAVTLSPDRRRSIAVAPRIQSARPDYAL